MIPSRTASEQKALWTAIRASGHEDDAIDLSRAFMAGELAADALVEAIYRWTGEEVSRFQLPLVSDEPQAAPPGEPRPAQ